MKGFIITILSGNNIIFEKMALKNKKWRTYVLKNFVMFMAENLLGQTFAIFQMLYTMNHGSEGERQNMSVLKN